MEVLERIRKEELVGLLSKLIAMDSSNPPGKEKEVASFVADYLERLGFRVRCKEAVEDRPNVLASIGRGRNALLIIAHTDVVPPGDGWKTKPFDPVVRKGKVYGRGASDAKGPLAAMLVAGKALIESDFEFNGRLVLAAVVDEETGSEYGTSYLVRKGILRSTYTIIAEPTGSDRIEKDEKGLVWVRLRVLGKQAHGSRPELGINAIEKMVKVLQAIRRLRLSYELHPLLGRPTLSINTIQGGVKTNIVPASCEVTIDIRTVPGQTLRDVMNQIKGVVRELERKDRELRVRVEKVLYGVPIEVGEEEPVVRALSSAIEEVVGRKARIVGTPGGTVRKEMVGKLPVGVIYGPGEPKVCHMANEYIRIADLLSGARIYTLTILKLLS